MKGNRDCSERLQVKTLRILRMIDMLAVYRFPKSIEEINREVCELTGLQCSRRTTQRDLSLLKGIGLVNESGGGYRLDLQRSERLQRAACALFG